MTDYTQAKTGRGYSTRYEDHRGLIYRLASQCFARLQAGQIGAMAFEDVYSEMCVAYTKSVEKYDPGRGLTFTAYLGRACYNHFNKIAERLELEQYGRTLPIAKREPRKAIDEMSEGELLSFRQECADAANPPPKKNAIDLNDKSRCYGLGLMSLDGKLDEDHGGSVLDILDVDADECSEGIGSTVEQALHSKQTVLDISKDRTLSPETRAYVLALIGVPLSERGKSQVLAARKKVRRELVDRFGTAPRLIKL